MHAYTVHNFLCCICAILLYAILKLYIYTHISYYVSHRLMGLYLRKTITHWHLWSAPIEV